MARKTKINRTYKDRLFRLLFGSYEMKDNIVSLYNALNHTAHDADDITEITTLDDVVYIRMKNDVSLLINSYMPLWEHQSTYNPNMPVKKAVDEAVKRCIKEDILRDFLKKHRAEVMNVCMTEYNEEVFVNGMLEAGRQEGLKAGWQEGLQTGRADSIRTLLRKGKSPTEIHDLLDYPMEEIVEVSKKLK
jgi:hypothetical protein